MVDWKDLSLCAAHADMLIAAGVTPALAKRRGYWTAEQADIPRLRNVLGFSDRQTALSAFPALILPMFPPGTSSRTPTTAQMRPAAVRRKSATKDGPKYESPARSSNRLDVHPANAKHLADVLRRLWFTEGIKKADALTVRGEMAIGMTGVWNWRGKATFDAGSTALGDFEFIALDGREIYVCFDSDANTNPMVRGAMKRLVGLLRSRGALVRFIVVPGDPALKLGADDFLAAGGTVDELIDHAVDELPSPTISLPLIDMAKELCERMEHQHLYVPEWSRWLVWDGRRWVDDVQALRTGQVAVRFIEELVEAIKDPEKRAKARHGINVRRARELLDNVVTMHREELTVTVDELDAHPLLLNVANGIVDLRTGELSPHDPTKLMTKITAGAYRKGVVSPDVIAATTELVRPDAVDWLQRLFGYAARGTVTQELFAVLLGDGANGKTTLLEGIGESMGDYADAVPSKLMTKRGMDEHATIEADLFGMRICWASETEDGVQLAIERIKSLTGGDKRKARRMRQDYWSFTPSHTLLLATNHLPLVSAGDWGVWRRLVLVDFPYRYTDVVEHPNDRIGDSDLRTRLRTLQPCLDAMVTWIVDGSVMFERRGLRPLPDSISAATLDWRQNSDLMLSFTYDRVTWDPRGQISQSEFVEAFNKFVVSIGRAAWTTQAITQQVTSTARQAGRELTRRKSNSLMRIVGVRWATDAEKATREADQQPAEPAEEATTDGSVPYDDISEEIMKMGDMPDEQG